MIVQVTLEKQYYGLDRMSFIVDAPNAPRACLIAGDIASAILDAAGLAVTAVKPLAAFRMLS